MVGIYKITSPSGRIYIGKSIDIRLRFFTYKRKDCKGQTLLYNSFCKYGIDSHLFEVIHELPDDIDNSILNEYEWFYISWYWQAGFKMLNIDLNGRYSNGKVLHGRAVKGKFTEDRIFKMNVVKLFVLVGRGEKNITMDKIARRLFRGLWHNINNYAA